MTATYTLAAMQSARAEIATLKQQNADLLAALESIIAGSTREAGGLGGAYITVSGDTLRSAEAAIRAARGDA